jgi:hypothetical protein
MQVFLGVFFERLGKLDKSSRTGLQAASSTNSAGTTRHLIQIVQSSRRTHAQSGRTKFAGRGTAPGGVSRLSGLRCNSA